MNFYRKSSYVFFVVFCFMFFLYVLFSSLIYHINRLFGSSYIKGDYFSYISNYAIIPLVLVFCFSVFCFYKSVWLYLFLFFEKVELAVEEIREVVVELESKNATRHLEISNSIDFLRKDLVNVEIITGSNWVEIAKLKNIK